MTASVAVAGWEVFVPGFANVSDWVAGRASPSHEAPPGALIPLRDRRRASPLSRALADVFAGAATKAGLAPAGVASVFGSALGEVSTMIGLLDQMWRDGTPLSPMKFATSVHNAASGTVSIAAGNRGFTTSLGADYDTPAMGLLEGIAYVACHGVPVIVCCGDEAPPEDLIPQRAGWPLLAAAVALVPEGRTEGSAERAVLHGLGLEPKGAHAEGGSARPVFVEPPALAEPLRRNPTVGLLDLVFALERGLEGRVRLDRGAGRGYSVDVRVARTA